MFFINVSATSRTPESLQTQTFRECSVLDPNPSFRWSRNSRPSQRRIEPRDVFLQTPSVRPAGLASLHRTISSRGGQNTSAWDPPWDTRLRTAGAKADSTMRTTGETAVSGHRSHVRCLRFRRRRRARMATRALQTSTARKGAHCDADCPDSVNPAPVAPAGRSSYHRAASGVA